jgi:hypothetical protein
MYKTLLQLRDYVRLLICKGFFAQEIGEVIKKKL